MDSLFDSLPNSSPAFDRDGFASRLAQLAQEGILFGGSSWKYEGWLGQIYSRSNYLTRGRFSKKLFEDRCLNEYATVFPTVCGDFAFYQFPSDDFWHKLFTQVPAGFQFGFKVPEQITCRLFPEHTRYGAQGGMANPTFLDADLFRELFLRPLDLYRTNVGVLIFEFGSFTPRSLPGGLDEFLTRLESFLRTLPEGFRYAVEIRNPTFFGAGYLNCLRRHNVAHVFNAWTGMPELPVQIGQAGSLTADFIVSRALLRKGRPYEDAVREFSPYSEVRDPYPAGREGLRELVSIARREKRTAFLFVNNRLEGNTPGTIVAVMDDE